MRLPMTARRLVALSIPVALALAAWLIHRYRRPAPVWRPNSNSGRGLGPRPIDRRPI